MRNIIAILIVVTLAGCSSVSSNISSEYYNVGNAYYDVGNFEKAIEYYTKALKEDHPLVNKIRYNLAVAYSESGRIEEGISNFKLLLKDDPDNLMVLQSLAYAEYIYGDNEKSLEYYDKILSIFEFDSTALFNKSLIKMEENKIEDAKELLEKLYTFDDSDEVVLKLGEVYKQVEDWDSLVRIFETSLADGEQNQDVLRGLIDYYILDKSYYKAIDYIDLLVSQKDFDDSPAMLFEKGVVQIVELNDFQSGFSSLKDAVQLGFSDLESVENLVDNRELIQADQLREYFISRGLY